MRIREVAWSDPAFDALRRAQQAEILALYGVPDIEADFDSSAVFVSVVAQEDDEYVSCGCLRELGGGVAEIKRMYTAPKWRHRGLGYAILTALEEHARVSRHTKLVLETGRKQRDALKLYERSGYGEIPNFGPYVGWPRPSAWANTSRLIRQVVAHRDEGIPHRRRSGASSAERASSSSSSLSRSCTRSSWSVVR